MIKKFLIAVAIAVPMLASAQTAKFGTINAEEVFAVMPESKTAQDEIAAASKQYEDEYAKLNAEMQKKFTEYQALQNDASTPQSIKDRRLQEMQDLDQKAQQFAETAKMDLQRKQQQLMQPIQEKLIKAIQEVGANNGFTMIFPAGVAYFTSTEVVDITPLVKTHLGIAANATPVVPTAPAATPAQ